MLKQRILSWAGAPWLRESVGLMLLIVLIWTIQSVLSETALGQYVVFQWPPVQILAQPLPNLFR